MEQEINKRQLNFLHHILTLNHQDPVQLMYTQQLKYKFEPNWANNVRDMRERYGILSTDIEISQMSKNVWKNLVKKKVKQYALEALNNELMELKIGSHIGQYNSINQQNYMNTLPPSLARTLFQVRAGVIDLKAVRKYWYDDYCIRADYAKMMMKTLNKHWIE